MSKVYKGEQPYEEFLRLQAQGQLFDEVTSYREVNAKKLNVLASRVVDDLGRDASWTDLKETLKSRAAGKVAYDAGLIVTSLENALRLRGEAIR